jgi:transglutaminase-like putative cysteine protease
MSEPRVDGPTWIRVAAGALVCLGAGVSATGMFSGDRDVLVVTVAVGVGAAVVVGLAAQWPSLSPRTRLAAAFSAVLAGTMLGLAPGAALVDGPRRLLTGALPLDPAGPELAAVALLVGFAAALAAELSLTRRRLPVAVLPGLAAQAVLLWVAAAGPAPPLAAAGITVAGCGLLLAGQAPRPRSTVAVARPRMAGARIETGRRAVVPLVLTTTAAVAAVTVATLLISPALPGRDLRAEPANARDLVHEPVQVGRATSPLARFPALQTGADRVLFLVRTTGRPDQPLRLRWATLDRFDGTKWTTRASFQRAGRNLPPGPTDTARGDRVRADVQVSDGSDVLWLPTIGRPVQVSVSGLGVDPRSGDLVVPIDATVPDRYTVTGVVPRFDAIALRSAVGETPSGGPAYDVPPALTRAAQSAVAGATTSFGRLAALETFFARSGGFSLASGVDAPAGHGIFQISQLLKDKSGTAEQYSSAFAVLARVLGFDSRVVMGFRATTGTSGSLRGTAVVRTRSVDAWPEIRLRDLGWVRFAPTPTRTADAQEPTGQGGDPDVEKAVEQEQLARSGGPLPPPTTPKQDAANGTPWWVFVVSSVAGVLVLALFALLLVPVAKIVRRVRRRGRDEPGGRLLGAWQEVLDRLTDHGLPASADLSRPEVARASAVHSPALASSVPPLADLADTAGFSGVDPDPGLDELAWRHADDARTALRRSTGVRGRITALFDPRSLLHRR